MVYQALQHPQLIRASNWLGEQNRTDEPLLGVWLSWPACRLSHEHCLLCAQMFWATMWVYNLALTTTKVSILVQYIRIFPPRHFRCACYAVLCIVVASGAWGIFGNVFMCYPINFFWDKTVQGRCLNDYIVWFSTAGLNIGQDVVILFLPIRVIRSLQISRSQKKGLLTMFALGAR